MRTFFLLLVLSGACSLGALETALYQTHSGENGLTITLDGKTWGPYEKIEAQAYSQDGSRIVVVARSAEGLVALTKEGPTPAFAADFSLEALKVAPDGQAWCLAVGNGELHQIWCAGKLWGPFPALAALEVANGGQWLMGAKTSDDSAQVWVNGQSQGLYQDVPYAAMSPDGNFWAFVGIRNEKTFFVTKGKTWGPLEFANTDALSWDRGVWGFSVGEPSGNLTWIVQGKEYSGYSFSGPLLRSAGGHWAFEAVKKTGQSFVVIDGKEFSGKNLTSVNTSSFQGFEWLQSEGEKVFLRTWHP